MSEEPVLPGSSVPELAGVTVASAAPRQTINWRRNLAALWLAQFVAIFGFSFVIPFLPIYLSTQLGVTKESELAFWTGLVVGASGFTQAVANPVWGLLADRFGRKPMLVRAMIGGGAVIVLMGLVRDPLQLLGTRLLLGVVAGSIAAANALVVSETPAPEMSRALGIMTSSVAMGRTIGPLVGGILAALVTLRNVFIGSGIVLSLAVLVVIFGARESARPRTRQGPSLRALRASGEGKLRRLGAITAAIGACQFAFAGAQGLLVLRLLRMDPAHIQVLTGIAFSTSGLATVAAATTYWRVQRRTGYHTFAVIVGIALAAAVALLALAPSSLTLILGTTLMSFVFGAVSPTLVSMVGLEAPPAMKATVIGFSQAATALGMAFGPLISGLTAAGFGLSAGLLTAAAVALLGSLAVLRWAREPLAHE